MCVFGLEAGVDRNDGGQHQLDAGQWCLMPDRVSGLTGSASESSLLDAMEFGLTTAASDHDGDAVTGAAVGRDVAKNRATG